MSLPAAEASISLPRAQAAATGAIDVTPHPARALPAPTPVANSTTRAGLGPLFRALCFLAPLAPFLLLIAAAYRYRVDVPYQCQWWFTYDLRLYEEGKLTFGNLWWQHNEHRLLFPKLLLLPIAHWTNWNSAYEVALVLAAALGTWAAATACCDGIVRWALGRARRSAAIGETSSSEVTGTTNLARLRALALQLAPTIFRVATALAIFSLAPWESWLWGWTIQFHLNLVAAFAGLALLARANAASHRPTLVSWPRLAGAAALGIVASYSFANGLMWWFAAMPLVAALGIGNDRRPRLAWAARLLAWGLLAGVVIRAFFHIGLPGFTTTYEFREIRPLPPTLATAKAVVGYLLDFLGAPLAPRSFAASQWMGAAGVAILLGGSWVLLRRGLPARRLTPVACVALYPVLSALMAVPGRVQSGDGAFNIPRHICIAAPFWVAVIAILMTLALSARQPATATILTPAPQATAAAPSPQASPARALAILTFALTCLLLIVASLGSIPDYRNFHYEVAQARDSVIANRNDQWLARIHNKPSRELELAPWLKSKHFSLFRASSAPPSATR